MHRDPLLLLPGWDDFWFQTLYSRSWLLASSIWAVLLPEGEHGKGQMLSRVSSGIGSSPGALCSPKLRQTGLVSC